MSWLRTIPAILELLFPITATTNFFFCFFPSKSKCRGWNGNGLSNPFVLLTRREFQLITAPSLAGKVLDSLRTCCLLKPIDYGLNLNTRAEEGKKLALVMIPMSHSNQGPSRVVINPQRACARGLQ